ncbi:hypothetical protein SUDANB95_08026 (plasmid) [Actinosynnema sp. ALI-1.44]
MTQAQGDGGGSPRASHEAYVRKVVLALADRGVQADDVEVLASAVRRAQMTVTEIEPMGTLWESAQSVRLLWDERNGWSWQVHYVGEQEPRTPIFFGLSAVPEPRAVADWMAVSLAHPEVTPSREDGPFDTPDLDVVLRAHGAVAG